MKLFHNECDVNLRNKLCNFNKTETERNISFIMFKETNIKKLWDTQ